jgi:anti-sigma regulatory factor (Ser/Thr protein kinase)
VSQVEIEIPSRSVYVGVVRLAFAALARSAGLGEEAVDDLRIAVGEACANAVIANEEASPDSPVSVNWSLEDEQIVIEVGDRGRGFDPESSGRDEDFRARMNLSMALLESLVDSCEVAQRSNGGMCTRLVVNL